MTDPALLATWSAALGTIVLASGAALRAWQSWLDLRRLELSRSLGAEPSGGRSEIGELRQRVRRLEAIADGTQG